ncbi:MAG TPA: hypothetical protein VHH88_12180 [Verrucomicrobiae bacterium]|nr:hypothetical protein [Verrucomicrobiae bacterium]
MSMINDALRRAKAAQDNAPAPANDSLEFKPVDPAVPSPGGGSKRRATIVLTAMLLAAGVVVLCIANREDKTAGNDISKAPVYAREAARPQSGATAPNASTPATRPASENTQNLPGTAASATVANNAGTNTAPQVAVAPPPPEPRLQAIVYNPARPSAIVDGQTLFVGDKLGKFTVAAIDQQSATLVSSNGNKILTLP